MDLRGLLADTAGSRQKLEEQTKRLFDLPRLPGMDSANEQLRRLEFDRIRGLDQEVRRIWTLEEEMKSHFGPIREPFEIQDRFLATAMEQARNSLLAVTRPFEDLRIGLADSVRVLFGPYSAATEMAQRAADETRRLFEPIHQLRAEAILFPELGRLQDAVSRYTDEFWAHWDDTEKRAFALLGKLGLVGLEAHLTRRELLRILHLQTTKGRNAVVKFIFARFRRDEYRLLNALTRRWWKLPYMEKRKKIVKSALRAHKKAEYELIIPALLPLVDGVAQVIMSSVGKASKSTIHVKEVAQMYHEQEDAFFSACVLTAVNTLLYRRVDFRQAKRPPSTANRHGILHGRVIGYGTELNSYRVILLLDLMVDIARRQPALQLASTQNNP